MSDVIDTAQLNRIEATHRGFFYQHIFAAACLIALAQHGPGEGRVIGIERDEDIELSTDSHLYYLQIKTRQRDLQRVDVADALVRFKSLESKLKKAGEKRELVFAIVANRSAGSTLAGDLPDWPENCHYVCPGQPLDGHPLVPEPTENISTLLEMTEASAETLAFPGLIPSTLVLKLAAHVQYVATGETDESHVHLIAEEELPALFETYVLQMQQFPLLPASYRPQRNEPQLSSGERVRLISGFSGAGKTAWASMQALTSPQPMIYCDIGSYPSAALASALAREIAASLLGVTGEAGRLPAVQGLDALSWVSDQLGPREIRPLIVLDNVHVMPADALRAVLDRTPNLDFILLGQPIDALPALAARIGITIENLEGWSRETVAAVFAESGSALDPASAERWRVMTAGLPLYVINAAVVSQSAYDGDTDTFLRDLSQGVEREATAQALILESVFEQLDDNEAIILCTLGRSGVSLKLAEIETIVSSIEDGISARRPLRRLSRLGLVQAVGSDAWRSHDALSVVTLAALADWPEARRIGITRALADTLFQSLQDQQRLDRLAVWIRLLPDLGMTEVLADLATNEIFHEVGNFDDLVVVLESFAADDAASADARFTALDALAYHAMQRDPRTQDIGARLTRMRNLLENEDVTDQDAPLTLAMKEMIFAGTNNDQDAVLHAFERAEIGLGDDPLRHRILRYNFAVSLFHLDNFHLSLRSAGEVALEIYQLLGIDPIDVVGANADDLRAMIGEINTETQDELKRLADCLSLCSMCQRALGSVPALTRVHAAKFYQQAAAWRSMAKEAQENAQDLLDLGDADGAINVFETFVLPVVDRFGLDDLHIEIRSFFAVTLAYAGRIEEARTAIAALTPYLDSLEPFQVHGIGQQVELIEEISRGSVRLTSSPFLRPAPLPFIIDESSAEPTS